MIGVPQLILVALIMMRAAVTLALFGEPKRGKYDWGGAFVVPAILLTLLWWGGFFGR